MGNPIVEFKELSFIYFLRNVSAAGLEHYCSAFNRIFQREYQDVSFRSAQLVEKFQSALFDTDRVRTTFSFDVSKRDVQEFWKLRLQTTLISHFEGGVVKKTPDNGKITWDIARLLLREGVADVITITQYEGGKKKWSLFHKSADAPVLDLMGGIAGIYLLLKIEAIPALRKKMKWETSDHDFDFYKFAEVIRASFDEKDSKQIVTIPFNDVYALKNFVADCDNKLLSRMTSKELNDLLASIEVSSNSWLNARII